MPFHELNSTCRPYWYLILGAIALLFLRRILLSVTDYAGSRTKRASRYVRPPSFWEKLVFVSNAIQTKYLDRPATLCIRGVNVCGALSFLEAFLVFTLYSLNGMLTLLYAYKWSTPGSSVETPLRWGAVFAAHFTFSNFPLLFATAGRNNLISTLTGIPYRSLNWLHRALGRMCFLLIIVHSTLFSSVIIKQNGPQLYLAQFSEKYWQCGILAITCLFVSFLFSFEYIRRRNYPFFITSHVLAAGLLLAMVSIHMPGIRNWLIGSATIWAVDRFTRLFGILMIHFIVPCFKSEKDAHFGFAVAAIDHLDGAVLLRIPLQMHWGVGQHLYLSFWSKQMLAKPWMIGRWHPFEITNLPNDEELQQKDRTDIQRGAAPQVACCVVQIRNGTTKWLGDYVEPTIKVLVQGPFGGNSHQHAAYSTLILVAGGAGITHVLASLEEVAQEARRGKSGRLQRVELYWMLRTEGHVAWVENRVKAVCAAFSALPLEIHTYVYITSRPSEPTWFPLRVLGSRPPLILSTTFKRVSSNQPKKEAHVISPKVRTRIASVHRFSPISPPPDVHGYNGNGFIHRICDLYPDNDMETLRPLASDPETNLKSDGHNSTGNPNSVFTIRNGRPNIESILQASCDRSAGRVLLHVCAPPSLSRAVRLAAAKLSSPWDTWNGKLNRCLVVHTELFDTA
ncbi:hypothetical protein CROQUDRAFT_670680 [Cronartium quercuum f. sp. fusiforme G11]|uniref:FAD-binding FR-type domain-containing protein n=1 Tax=Cronartium quercuum f. sp. fusiforme G11 TaxID=708437 RepID=A0A9P6NP80_9BASI|nr:hypothetical protein CROQUDRAFT_670680 [Cronartium quercuum f. sp. fusiforme G11]